MLSHRELLLRPEDAFKLFCSELMDTVLQDCARKLENMLTKMQGDARKLVLYFSGNDIGMDSYSDQALYRQSRSFWRPPKAVYQTLL